MKNLLIYGLALGFCFASCSKEKLDDKLKVIEQSTYSGLYSVIDSRLVGFKEDMQPVLEKDTFHYKIIDVIYTRRVDSVFLESDVFKMGFVSEHNGASGEQKVYLSLATNAKTSFTKTDSILNIEGNSWRGDNILGVSYNGKKL